MSTTDISVSNTLQRSHTLPTSCDSHSAQKEPISIDHYLGGLTGYHYVPLQRFPRGHSRPLGFSSLINTVPLPKGRVTNKTKSRTSATSLGRASTVPDPIDGPTTKPTTPLVSLINQLRVSHSTLMVSLLSQVSLPK